MQKRQTFNISFLVPGGTTENVSIDFDAATGEFLGISPAYGHLKDGLYKELLFASHADRDIAERHWQFLQNKLAFIPAFVKILQFLAANKAVHKSVCGLSFLPNEAKPIHEWLMRRPKATAHLFRPNLEVYNNETHNLRGYMRGLEDIVQMFIENDCALLQFEDMPYRYEHFISDALNQNAIFGCLLSDEDIKHFCKMMLSSIYCKENISRLTETVPRWRRDGFALKKVKPVLNLMSDTIASNSTKFEILLDALLEQIISDPFAVMTFNTKSAVQELLRFIENMLYDSTPEKEQIKQLVYILANVALPKVANKGIFSEDGVSALKIINTICIRYAYAVDIPALLQQIKVLFNTPILSIIQRTDILPALATTLFKLSVMVGLPKSALRNIRDIYKQNPLVANQTSNEKMVLWLESLLNISCATSDDDSTPIIVTPEKLEVLDIVINYTSEVSAAFPLTYSDLMLCKEIAHTLTNTESTFLQNANTIS